MHINELLLENICDIAVEVGDAILEIYNSNIDISIKCDGSPLTEADIAADIIIKKRLKLLFPEIYLVSEEDCPKFFERRELFFLIDPLDGTKEFIKRNGEFTVNIALIYKGYPIAGVVYAPALGELYFASSRTGAWKKKSGKKERIACQKWSSDKTLRIIGSRSHICQKTLNWMNTLGYQYELISAGSSLKFCRVAEGTADLYPRFSPTSQWDTAAGHCILEQAGGSVTNSSGQAFMYGTDRPIINSEFIATSSVEIFNPNNSITENN
jgi:3'(2'), 5'-bisphosphate nucleotidase